MQCDGHHKQEHGSCVGRTRSSGPCWARVWAESMSGKREGDRSRPRKTSRNYSKRFVKIESIVSQIFRGALTSLLPRAHTPPPARHPAPPLQVKHKYRVRARSVFRAGAGASTHLTRHGQTQPPPRATHIDSSAPANPAITPLAASLLNSFFEYELCFIELSTR
jgi:hypothetical protein